jgi:hypothetical protein
MQMVIDVEIVFDVLFQVPISKINQLFISQKKTPFEINQRTIISPYAEYASRNSL